MFTSLTNVAHNFQHIIHFEVYASMFKSKGPCKNYCYTTHTHTHIRKVVHLKLYDYIYTMVQSHYPCAYSLSFLCVPIRMPLFCTLCIDANFAGWKLFCSRNSTKSSMKVNIDEISNLKWWGALYSVHGVHV